jgi:RimJ/RimL family protein N-acetyltransferase/GNAT superfamily N-acetyltransferase
MAFKDTIKTERLILRPWRQEDLDPFAQMNADPRVMEYFPSTLTRKESDALAQRISTALQEQGWGLWAVSVPNIADFIGFIGLDKPSINAHFMPAVEVGWRLAFDYWGKCYATEGAKAALAYGFATLNLSEIVSMAAVQNMRSRAVMTRIGMRRDPKDDFDNPKLPEGHPLRRHVLYRIGKKEWQAQQKQRGTRTGHPHSTEYRFAPAKASQQSMLHEWFEQKHIKEWMHGAGLQNTLNGLEKFFRHDSTTTYWIAYDKNIPFAFLITSPEGGEAITLDLFICDGNYLGKGLSVLMIREFLIRQFPKIKRVLVDPEATNSRAIHVYKKAGFKIIGEFIASWHPVPHYQMELQMENLLKKKKEPHVRMMTLPIERETAKRFRQKYFFDRVPVQDPYLWTFDHKDHLHFILYDGDEIVGYAHVQLWPDHRAAMRIIVIDEPARGHRLGTVLMKSCERALKNRGITLLQTEASPAAYHFYKKLGYVEMPFDNPEREPTHPSDRAMGKYL